MRECVIIGAGIGGLSAAAVLVDRGVKPLIVEADGELKTKVCGEFLSYECLPLLHQWGVKPAHVIEGARFHFKQDVYDLRFPVACATMQRLHLERRLLERALKKGAEIWWDTKVERVESGKELFLSNGQTLQAGSLIISTGRYNPESVKVFPRYLAIKTHVRGLTARPHLDLFLFPDAYLGVSYLGDGITVVSCLARYEQVLVDEPTSADGGAFIAGLMEQSAALRERLKGAEGLDAKWATAPVGRFGVKEVPAWPAAYFVGDAAATIPPACGDGLAMAVTSGAMAADSLIRGDFGAYRRQWKKSYKTRIAYATFLHGLLFSPRLLPLTFSLAQHFEPLGRFFFERTRQRPPLAAKLQAVQEA